VVNIDWNSALKKSGPEAANCAFWENTPALACIFLFWVEINDQPCPVAYLGCAPFGARWN